MFVFSDGRVSETVLIEGGMGVEIYWVIEGSSLELLKSLGRTAPS